MQHEDNIKAPKRYQVDIAIFIEILEKKSTFIEKFMARTDMTMCIFH